MFAVSLITPDDRPPSAAARALIDLVLTTYPNPDSRQDLSAESYPIGHETDRAQPRRSQDRSNVSRPNDVRTSE
jgi:hypothetical protein